MIMFARKSFDWVMRQTDIQLRWLEQEKIWKNDHHHSRVDDHTQSEKKK